MKKILLMAVAGVLIVGGAAFFAVRAFMGPVEDEAIALVPDGAVVYVNAFLNPSTSQKRALRDLLERFEKIETPDKAGDLIAQLVDDALEGTGATYDEDVEPWLGRQAAFYLGSDFDVDNPGAAALIATEDQAATQAFIDKLEASDAVGDDLEERSYGGFDYLYNPLDETASGFVEGFWVIGAESAFEDVVDTSRGGPSLAESERYQDTIAPLDDDYLGLVYFDSESLFEAAVEVAEASQQPFPSLPGLENLPPTALIAAVSDDSLIVESASARPQTGLIESALSSAEGPELLPQMPADAWLAIGASEVGQAAEEFIDAFDELEVPGADFGAIEGQIEAATGLDLRSDVLSWMGDLGLFVQGNGVLTLGGALVIESHDPDASSATVDAVRDQLTQRAVLLTETEMEGYSGFEIRIPSIPQPLKVLAGEKVVVAVGAKSAADAISADETLEDESDVYQQSADDLGGGFTTQFFLNMDGVQALVESFVPAGTETYENEVKPWLGPLSHISSGTRVDGDIIIQKFVIGVE